MNGKYKSLGYVIWRILKNPLCAELTQDEAAEYALEFIRIIGAPLTYLDKVQELELNDYRAELPCDLIHLKGVEYNNCNNFASGLALRYASDNFHVDNKSSLEATYTLQKGYIVTSIEDGYIRIAYKAVALDEDGYPLIPDEEKVLLAVEYFILHRYLEPFWMMGKITDKVFQYIRQQRDWYVGAADSTMRAITPDQYETMVNGINRLIRSNTAHSVSFRNLGEKEVLKRYN